ncbi:class A rhodopsin-like G-protein coupled receptor GPR5ht3, putative [Pediculus humanus corporis]|uniref:Class A rhodopsin-like G-protein coupled receptor GPR5ht3, putative n=1 Tax=Pediculus humanus subsp. corporis TaxID=121224 RepID=E0VHA7_PEDHC|nr:class A rhodopsin-like G-protein coupled receptor GPR5ht3, putative [Pediculus humanus corporis]EEB12763.1 class A rhodopsin-like G-protein coupled receptor GPR5ht3, putative [Pediculus humanus corporis]
MEGSNYSIIHSVLIAADNDTSYFVITNTQSPSTGNFVKNNTQDGFATFWFPGEFSPYSVTEAIIIAIILLLIIVGTVVGNILVCIAVCLVKKLRRPCNYLLVSLAVSDICVAVLVMPMATLYEILGKWSFGPVMCDLWVSFDVLSCTASILNLCMISVDRYYAITKPLQYGVKRTPRRMILCVSLVWLGAACISLPPLLILGNQHELNNTTQCIVCQNFAYQIYATLGSFYIPLTVMMIVYYKIFRAARRIVLDERQSRSHLESHCCLDVNVGNGGCTHVVQSISSSPAVSTPGVTNRVHHHHHHHHQHRSSTASTVTTCSGVTNISTRCFPRTSNESQVSNFGASTSQKRIRFQLAKERKASTTLGIIMSAFTVCWLPFFVLAIVRPFLNEQSSIPASLSSLFLWLGYANSLLNPIIYATLNRDFRKPFQQILYFRCSTLNDMMREEFYHSQYGDPHYTAINNSNIVPMERPEDRQPSSNISRPNVKKNSGK